jgi:hypothetical protein
MRIESCNKIAKGVYSLATFLATLAKIHFTKHHETTVQLKGLEPSPSLPGLEPESSDYKPVIHVIILAKR